MEPRIPIDNNKLANLILSKRMATREQIVQLWPQLSPAKDIGMLLVERGMLPQPIYLKMVDFLRQSAAVAPSEASRQAAAPLAVKKTSDQPIAGQPPPVSALRQPPGSPTAEKAGTTPAGRPAPFVGEEAARPAEEAEDEAPAGPMISVDKSLNELLAFTRSIDASDLHLSVNNPVIVRRYGVLTKVSADILTPDIIEHRVRSILSDAQHEAFLKTGDLEFIYMPSETGRFRVTVMKQRAGWDLTARCVPRTIRPFEHTGMPEACKTLTKWAQGLVLVTGPACCGKSSSLATLIEMINQTRSEHVITIESPIEFIFEPKRAKITQRQIGRDTADQDAALRAALREDPDIIVVGELRDLATIRLAVSAAETGHLVFATMNTISASRTIYRLIDSFPAEEQGIIRNMVSESLRGVISQQLIRRKDGTGMVAAFEVLIVNSAVANMIRKDEAHQLGSAMITGKAIGMQLLDDSLKSLVSQGLIAPEEASKRCLIRPASGKDA